jgi:hypothetical protein
MKRNFKWLEWRMGVMLMFAMFLCVASSVNAQYSAGIVAKMLFPPKNYEIVLGGTVTPRVRIINNGMGSVAGTKIFYRIRNTITGLSPYYDSLNLPTIAPGDSVDTAFAPYATNSQIIRELGTFNACLTIGQDTLNSICGLLFGIRRTSVPFFDPSDNYGKTITGELSAKSIDIPDQTLWVSLGASVVDGEDSTWDPPPPRYPPDGVGPDGFVSPVLRLDRLDYNGKEYPGTIIGDTLTSFPINLAGHQNVYFSFDYMRAGRHHYSLDWDDSAILGPESTITDSTGNVICAGDSLILEFKKPSEPATNSSPNGWNEIAAIDGGRDFEFKSFLARPTDSGWQITVDGKLSFLKDTNSYNTSDFRFRFRLKANNNAPNSSLPILDADQWYIDNPLLEPAFLPQVEVSWVRVVNPYTKVPRSQAVFPIFVNSHNVDVQGGMPDFPLQVDITNPKGDTVYSQYIKTGTWYGSDTLIQFPDWDASHEPGNDTGAYTVFAEIPVPFNPNSQTQGNYSKFYLNFDNPSDTAVQEFALDNSGLDPGLNDGNDIPKLVGIQDEGIGFINTSGSFAMKFQLVRPDTFYGARLYFADVTLDDADYFRISLLNGDPNSCTPLDTVVQPGKLSSIFTQRYYWNQLYPYYFPQPIPLQPGTYWVSVSQLSVVNIDLGGIISRGGGQIVRSSKTVPLVVPVYSSPYGTQWGSGPSDNNGNIACLYAVEMPAGSGKWKPMMPDSGLWPVMDTTNSLTWHILPNFDSSPYIGAGTYLPTIRAMFAGNPTSGVKKSSAIPNFGLEYIYPNPFASIDHFAKISYTLDVQGPATLTISNILGNTVKTLVDAPMSAGSHSVLWDGRDESGAFVPAGTYLIFLSSGDHRTTEKLIVME